MSTFFTNIFKSWKTSLCGTIAAIGTYWTTLPELHTFGVVLTGLGLFLTGVFAKDGNVTGGTTPSA